MYLAVVGAVAAVHFLFIGYVAAGGFLAWRWRPTIWLHLLAVAWGIAITLNYVECPLTLLERWARATAGMAPLPSNGFIAYYITGVLYPDGWSGLARAAVFGAVAVSWLGWWLRRKSSDRTAAP